MGKVLKNELRSTTATKRLNRLQSPASMRAANA